MISPNQLVNMYIIVNPSSDLRGFSLTLLTKCFFLYEYFQFIYKNKIKNNYLLQNA